MSSACRARPCTVALVLGVIGVTSALSWGRAIPAARAAEDPPWAAAQRQHALETLREETALLVEAGALGEPLPRRVRQAHEHWDASFEGLTREQLLDRLEMNEQRGVAALSDLRASGAKLTGPIDETLGALPEGDRHAVIDGKQISIPPGTYGTGIRDIESLDFPAPEPTPVPGPGSVPDLHVAMPVMPTYPRFSVPTSITTTSTTVRSSRPVQIVLPPIFGSGDRNDASDDETLTTERAASDGPSPWAAALAGAALAVSVAAAISAVRWRARRVVAAQRRATDARMDQLLEAGRRVGRALDPAAVAQVAVEQAVQLTDGAAGALVTVRDGALVAAHASVDGLLVTSRLAQGVLARVLDTGQSVDGRVSDEPALASLPAALVVTPVISGGRVTALLLVTRHERAPFRADERTLLERFAPMVASALDTAAEHGDVADLALRDGLTDLGNRRRLDRELPEALARGAAAGAAVACAMVDVDHFKAYNDTFGHQAGDDLLRQVAGVLRDEVRAGDVVYRYGGEEFCVLLPGTTADEAAAVVERLREAVETGTAVTVSAGLAVAVDDDPRRVLGDADRALYRAKRRGRNRVALARSRA